jgi:RND superfamily putative drug exporter
MAINLTTEALARGTGRRPWITIGIWLVALVVAFLLTVALLGDALTTKSSITSNPESEQAYTLLEERLGRSNDTIDEIVIVRSATLTVGDPAYRGYVEELFGDIMALGDGLVAGGVHYYLTDDDSLVSADRRTTLVPLVIPEDGMDKIGQVHEVVSKANQENGFRVLIAGEATLGDDFMTLAENDLKTGEVIGIAVALVILALVFGALAAALLPLVLAIVAVVVALGATALVGQALELSFFMANMIVMMGLATGIDYSLFIVSRYREERARGLQKIEAIATAGATANRAVLFSGMTVVLALASLLIFPVSFFQSIGIGAILVVIAAVLASLTLLPAMLGLLGDKVNAIRIPLIQRRRSGHPAEAGSGFWEWTARTVMRRPFPDGIQSKEGFVILQEEFGGAMDLPAMVVIDGQTDSESVQKATERLGTTVAADRAFGPSKLEAYPEANLSVFSVMLASDPMGKEAMDGVVRLRADYIPEAFDGVPAKALVTGLTAEHVDFTRITDTYTPLLFVFVLGLSLLLLTVAFRSIVVPITSIIMNLLSVGAAYGLLVLVFQNGVGADLFGFQRVDTIELWLPMFLFAILFGLSMDYHVFLLSRIRERFLQTANNSESVAFGLRCTGSLITGAALIMVAVFGGFALGDMVMFQQMGFGLAVAVLIDATIVRSVLVPATMRLLGRRNWYLPKWLDWLPRASVGEGSYIEAHTAGTVKEDKPVGLPILEATPVPVDDRPRET